MTMRAFVLATALLSTCVFASIATFSHAATVVNEPDDICPPSSDPCVVDQIYEIAAPGELDFGLRTVRVTAAGRLEQTVSVSCGAFVAVGGSGKIVIDSKNGGSDAGSATITARRACSGDGVTPCLEDSLCVGLALGTCSVGTGTVDIDARIKGNGPPGGTLVIRSAGDIAVGGHVNINATVAGGYGGLLEIESFMGSVTVTATVDARAGPPAYYSEPDDSSTVILRASEDVTLAGVLDKGGAQWGGLLIIEAGRDVLVKESININAGGLVYANGGNIEIEAGRDLVIAKRDAAGKTRITAKRGSDKQGYGTYADFYGGQGGYLTFLAAADLTIEDQVHIETNAALRQGLSEGYPYGEDIYAISGGTATGGAKLLTGSDASGEDLVIEVCRLAAEPGGSIDHSLRDAQSYTDANNNVLTIHESMTVEVGGEIVAARVDGGRNTIRYRDPAKPPVRDGTVDPASILIIDPSLVGCRVCGN